MQHFVNKVKCAIQKERFCVYIEHKIHIMSKYLRYILPQNMPIILLLKKILLLYPNKIKIKMHYYYIIVYTVLK